MSILSIQLALVRTYSIKAKGLRQLKSESFSIFFPFLIIFEVFKQYK